MLRFVGLTNAAVWLGGAIFYTLVVAPALEARDGSDRIIAFGTEGLAGKVELSLISCEPLGHGALHLRFGVKRPE